MSKKTTEWQKVFKYAVVIAKEKCAKNKNLTYQDAMKKAWKDPRVLKKKSEYAKKKKAAINKKKPAKKKVVKKVVKKKPKKVVKKPAKKK